MAESRDNQLDGWWVTGLIDGEGCFYAGLVFRNKRTSAGREVPCVELQIELAVALRADDGAVLHRLQRYFGCGVVRKKTVGKTAPSRRGMKNPRDQILFVVRNPKDLLAKVVPHFEKFPLQSKKARDFETWKKILSFYVAELEGRKRWLNNHPEKVRELGTKCDSLKSGREFVQPAGSAEN